MSKKSTTAETAETDDTPTNETQRRKAARSWLEDQAEREGTTGPRRADPFSGQFGGMPEGSPLTSSNRPISTGVTSIGSGDG